MTMAELNLFVADELDRLERKLKRVGLKVNRMTLVARNSSDDEMGICVTNEPKDDLPKAFNLAMEKWT